MTWNLAKVEDATFRFINETTGASLELTRSDLDSITDQVRKWEIEQIVKPVEEKVRADCETYDRYYAIDDIDGRLELVKVLRADYPQLSVSASLALSKILFP